MCPFMRPDWADKLIFFVPTCDISFASTDGEEVHLCNSLSLCVLCYFGPAFANIFYCTAWQLIVHFSNSF